MTEKEGYRIVEQLGTGLAGPVFLAESEAGQVAIRHFQPQSPRGTEQAAFERLRFVQSARRASTLRQAGIVSVLEVLDEGEDSFSAVEYVPHKTLKEALEQQAFPIEESTRLIRRVARTLHYANQNGVVHGDFKPSNVFLLPADEVKVSDFAVSPRAWPDPRVLPAEWAHAYLAPEYYYDRDRVGPRSDQYALAATAYHLYTQRLPFRAPSETIGERRGLPAASSIRPQIPAATDAVLARALSNNPNDRFGSCLEFSEALTASFVPPVPAPAKSDRKPALIPLLLVAAGGVLLVLLTVWLLRSRQPTPTAHNVAPQPAIAPAAPAPSSPPQQPEIASRRPEKKPDAPKEKALPPRPRPAELPPPRQKPVELTALRQVPAAPLVPVPAAAEENKPVNLEVYSRDRKVEPGITFSAKDWVIGEMGQGDLKAVVRGRPAKGRLTLDWYVDDIRMDSSEVVPNKVVAYGNEPTAGSYRVVLRQNAKELSRFTFRITQ